MDTLGTFDGHLMGHRIQTSCHCLFFIKLRFFIIILIRRNFGEPVHMDWDCYTEDRFEPQSNVKGYWPEGHTYGSMRKRGFLVIFTILVVYYSTCNVVADYPILPKQWPADVTCKGMKHYTFEIDDEC